jgi:hypothetical protein
VFLPYCLQRLADGRYIVLNRRYKPLGVQTREWVDYDTHPSAARMKITAATARKLSWKSSDDVAVIHLYNDGCVPDAGADHLDAYAKRLAVFMKLPVELPPAQ